MRGWTGVQTNPPGPDHHHHHTVITLPLLCSAAQCWQSSIETPTCMTTPRRPPANLLRVPELLVAPTRTLWLQRTSVALARTKSSVCRLSSDLPGRAAPGQFWYACSLIELKICSAFFIYCRKEERNLISLQCAFKVDFFFSAVKRVFIAFHAWDFLNFWVLDVLKKRGLSPGDNLFLR